MKIPDIITDNDSFWDHNPQYKYILSDFYNKDKSKNKNKSSKIVWAIYFRTHPKSDFYRLPDKDDVIKTKWLRQPNFDWESIEDVQTKFVLSTLTQAEKSLIAWDDTMRKRDHFIHSQAFTLDTYGDKGKIVKGTADQLDRMLSNTSKLYGEYFKISKELSNDEIKRGKGNKPKSMSDADDI